MTQSNNKASNSNIKTDIDPTRIIPYFESKRISRNVYQLTIRDDMKLSELMLFLMLAHMIDDVQNIPEGRRRVTDKALELMRDIILRKDQLDKEEYEQF